MTTDLPDGLYAVVQPKWVAGFIVRDGRIRVGSECAPILRGRLRYWTTVARRVN